MILSFVGMLKLVHLQISAFRNVLDIDFDGTERVYLILSIAKHCIAHLCRCFKTKLQPSALNLVLMSRLNYLTMIE